jgi:hypothetical protein
MMIGQYHQNSSVRTFHTKIHPQHCTGATNSTKCTGIRHFCFLKRRSAKNVWNKVNSSEPEMTAPPYIACWYPAFNTASKQWVVYACVPNCISHNLSGDMHIEYTAFRQLLSCNLKVKVA